MGFCLAFGVASPAVSQVLGPAELPPADFAADVYTDSLGCVFLRGTANGTVMWLPRLDAQRRPVCGPRDTAQAASPEVPVAEVPLADGPAIAEAPVTEAPADPADKPEDAPAATAQAPAAPAPEPQPPAQLALPEPLAPLAPQAATGGLVADAPPTVRLIFVEPDDRVRIVQVDMPSILIGGDMALRDLVTDRRSDAPTLARRIVPGYAPRPVLLTAAPPIRGFGPDPAPVPRLRRAAAPAEVALHPWNGSSPAPLPRDRTSPDDRG